MSDPLTTDPIDVGHVSFLPSHTGDGYNYGGGIVVTIGERSLLVAGIDPMKGYLEKDLKLAYQLAAAPDLLAALKRLLVTQYPGTENHHETGCRCVIHEAQVAIAKAEGRS